MPPTSSPIKHAPESEPGSTKLVEVSEDGSSTNFGTDIVNFGFSSPEFVNGLLKQVVNIASKGQMADEEAIAFETSIIVGAQPRDELESMLVAHMAAIHNATMTFSRRLSHVENIPQQDSAERALNKLARTYALQLQALQKYRSGGKHSMVVRHVHVNEGGQAIVGNVEAGGR